MRIVSGRRRIRSAIRFTSRFHPHEGVYEGVAGVRSWTGPEASAFDIAPVPPSLLLRRLHATAALVDNEVRREPVLLEERCDGVNVQPAAGRLSAIVM